MTTLVKYKFPKKIGECADKLYLLRQKRLETQKLVDALEAEEKALKYHIIMTLPKSEASGVAGKLARVTVVNKSIPQISDWEQFAKYLKKTGDFDLIQHRLSPASVEERWEAGKEIPGVGEFKATTVSINKI